MQFAKLCELRASESFALPSPHARHYFSATQRLGHAQLGSASVLEHGSDRSETLPKRFSNDPHQFILWRKRKSTKLLGLDAFVSLFWANFGGWTGKRTSKSSSSQYFALDAPILRSVRPKNLRYMTVYILYPKKGFEEIPPRHNFLEHSRFSATAKIFADGRI